MSQVSVYFPTGGDVTLDGGQAGKHLLEHPGP